MKEKYDAKLVEIYEQIGDHAKMVLATSYNNHVSARKMSFVIMDGKFLFQTDKNFRKANDIKMNSNVALCIDNIQIEGIAKEIGHPLDNEEFVNIFQKYYPSSFEAFSKLDDERLYVVEANYIKRWNYVNDKPLVEELFIDTKTYKEELY